MEKKLSFKEVISINFRGLRFLSRIIPMKIWWIPVKGLVDTLNRYWDIIFIARFVDDLVEGVPQERLLLDFLLLTVGKILWEICDAALQHYYFYGGSMTWEDANGALNCKLMAMDYEYMESETIQNERRDLDATARYNGGGLCFLYWNAERVQTRLLSMMVAVFFVLQLLSRSRFMFQGVRAAQVCFAVGFGGLIAVLLAVSTRKGNALQGKMQQCTQQMMKHTRLNQFYVKEYISKAENGKIIRMFHQQKLLLEKTRELYEKIAACVMRYYRADASLHKWMNSIDSLISGCIYLLVGIMALEGAISIGGICLYAGCISRLMHELKQWTANYTRIVYNTEYVKRYFDFLDIPNKKYEGTLPVEKRDDDRFTIEFRHVSFHYPGSVVDVLKDFSITFRIGERLAVVGRNGCGKTTFIKLLCRLYDPTEGEILLNGIDIRKYDYREYLSLFSVVFQDFQIPAFSLGQTVACAEHYEEMRVRDALLRAGLSQLLERMPQGLDTYLTKNFDAEGVDISGGEAQKLAIARALYHDTPFVILDEPTAALDPLAEYEVYAKFDELVGSKTAVYISHRLSSCQFCNDILVIDEGRAVQRGSHETLLKERGLYAMLWCTQAQYYQ